jgi:hypothetical protein
MSPKKNPSLPQEPDPPNSQTADIWLHLERWSQEHLTLCQLDSSLMFSKQDTLKNYRQLVLDSANYGHQLIANARKCNQPSPDALQPNREKIGSMIPLSGFSRFEERAYQKMNRQSVGLTGHSQVLSQNSSLPGNSSNSAPLPSKTYIQRIKKN